MPIAVCFDSRPSFVPESWTIYNAPRPLYGSTLPDGRREWTGDFLRGIFYVAVDPADPYAATWKKENEQLHAHIVQYRTDEWVRAWVNGYYHARYDDKYGGCAVGETLERMTDADYRQVYIDHLTDDVLPTP